MSEGPTTLHGPDGPEDPILTTETKVVRQIVISPLVAAILGLTVLVALIVSVFFIQEDTRDTLRSEARKSAAAQTANSRLGCERNVKDRLDDARSWNAAMIAREKDKDWETAETYRQTWVGKAERVIICPIAFPFPPKKPRNVMDRDRIEEAGLLDDYLKDSNRTIEAP